MALYDDAYAREPFVELRLGPPGVRDVRDTNFCRISVHGDARTGRDHRLRGDRQPVEGRRVAGGPEPQPDVRPRRARGAARELLRSRWVAARRRGVDRARRRPAGRLPRRGRAARASSRPATPTSALLVSDAPDTASAARFTRSGVLAAPVLLCQERCRLDALRAVVVNSGNANAATGRPRARGRRARCRAPPRWRPACTRTRSPSRSTGVIGVPLPMDGVIGGILAARGELRRGRRRRLLARDRDHRRVREAARRSTSRCPRARVRAERAGQGRGDDPAGLRDDALLRADRRRAAARDRRPAARRVRQALVRPHLASTASSRRTTPRS